MSQYGSIPRKIHFSITFWGRWHTDALIKSLLPSLLTDGNLPALARDYALEFSFLTTPDDRTSLEASGAYKKLRNLATIEIVENADLIPERRFAIHHKWWRRAIKRARKESAYLGLIPPDICFSDGSMEAIGKRIAGGAACLYISGVRVASETFLPEIIAGFEDGTKNFPSHFDLVHLSLRHSHPFNNSLYLGAPRAPYIAEMMLAPVPGTGWVKNCYLAGPIVFVDPRRTTINAANIVTAIDDPHDFHVIYDSHEVGMVSLAPLNLYAEWSLGCETEDAFTKAFKLRRHYTNISSDIVSRDNFLIYQNQDDRKMPSWIEAEQKINAASLAIQCNLALLDVGDALDRCNFKATSAAIFLTAVTSEAFPEIDMSVPLICAFPRDDQVKRMVKNLDSEGLYNFTFRHIYHHFDLNNGTATNLLGETLHIEKTDGHIMINGVEARCHRTIGRITIYTLAYVGLTRCASKEFKISAERHAYAVIGLGRQRTEIRHVLGQSRIHLRSWLIRRLSPMCYRLLTFAVSELIDLAV